MRSLRLTESGLKPIIRRGLKYGQIIFMEGYGYSKGDKFAVFNIKENPGFQTLYDCVNILRPDNIKTVDSTIRPESEIFGIGWYYYEPIKIATKEEIFNGLFMSEEFKKSESIRLEKEHKEREEYIKQITKKYHYLEKVEGYNSAKVVGKNIRTELKKEFPGIKFSVRKDHYSCYLIRYPENFKDIDKLESICNKYQHGNFNGMEDIYEHGNNAFNDIFGGVNYIFINNN